VSSPLQTNPSDDALPVRFELAGKRVFVAGHTGMAGSAIVRRLRQEPCDVLVVDHRELDLTRQDQTERYLSTVRPDIVIMAAGRVGGILANDSYPVHFLADNLAMALNCIHVSHLIGVQKLLFLGSSCVYPKFAKQPMSEDQLLTGELEPTNEWYAIAKSPASSCARLIDVNTTAISCQ
jgi:GDP-L-fucose synthase